ncbi:hypothetical protein ACWEQ7_04350 [Streptomyces sp. NPDC004069]
MTELEELRTAYHKAVEAHRTHPPRLRRGRDGIYRCAACDPAGRRERVVDWLVFNHPGWTRRCRTRLQCTVLLTSIAWRTRSGEAR